MAAIKKTGALAALTQAALALPGIAHAAPEMQAEYLYSNYSESDIPAAQTTSGKDSKRYQINTHQFRLLKPMDGERTLGVNLSYESLSGASPWYITPSPDGKPLQVMSGASIKEDRTVARATWSQPLMGAQVGFTGGFSTEDDYESINGGVELALDNADKSITWSGGIGYSADRIEPERGPSSPNVIDHADKDTLTLYGGAALVIDEDTVAQGSLSYIRNDGFLSDPYKLAWVQSATNALPDSRPGSRNAWVLSAKVRHHLDEYKAAIAADYRYYTDDWHIEAHTAEVAWHQVLPQQWRVSPAIRWYSQSRAYFYSPWFINDRGDGLRSSDYRLSPFGALSLRVDASKTLGQFDVGGGVEWYEADKRWALKKVTMENPALVEYLVANLRLTYRF